MLWTHLTVAFTCFYPRSALHALYLLSLPATLFGVSCLCNFCRRNHPGTKLLDISVHLLYRQLLVDIPPLVWNDNAPSNFKLEPRKKCHVQQEIHSRGPYSLVFRRKMFKFHTYIYIYMCVCVYVCLSVCMSVCMSVCLYVCMSVGLSVCRSVGLSVCRSVGLSVCRSVGLSVCRSVSLSVCRSVCLSVGLSVCLYATYVRTYVYICTYM